MNNSNEENISKEEIIEKDAVVSSDNNENAEAEEQISVWKTGWRKEVIDWIEAIGIAVIVAVVLKTFVMTLAVVDGASMENTLHHGERLYVNKLFYTPEKGDVVIVDTDKHPEGPLVKRVIATEGDTVYIDPYTSLVYINDELIEEEYIKGETVINFESFCITHGLNPLEYSRENPIVLGTDEVFVMGDNRQNSSDSRNLGVFTEDEILGHAVFRFWPIKDFGMLD